MAKKDRDYDVIIKNCKDFANAVQDVRRSVELLSKEAAIAESTLKDCVAKKNIDAIKDLCKVVRDKTAMGEERIRELERKMEKEKDDFERLYER